MPEQIQPQPPYIIPKNSRYPVIKLIPNVNGKIQDIKMFKSPVNALPCKCEECKPSKFNIY